jgi:pimeloyl-ACP methyl ester carboxylesterase
MKTFINNRVGQKLCVVVEGTSEVTRLAFVMHGLGGDKNQPHIRAMIEAFLESGYTVVSFDTTNSFGESDGDYQDATVTNYYADLEDVIAWAQTQAWYTEPFVLCGHSLGGISTALFAEKHPKKVKALAPISAVVSGKLSFEAYDMFDNQAFLDEWKHDGIRITTSHDGRREKRLKWNHMEDRLKYNLLPDAHKLTMPVLLVAGQNDTVTPLVHQQLLYEKVSGPKEIHEIKGALHSFYEPHEQQELKRIMKNWLITF